MDGCGDTVACSDYYQHWQPGAVSGIRSADLSFRIAIPGLRYQPGKYFSIDATHPRPHSADVVSQSLCFASGATGPTHYHSADDQIRKTQAGLPRRRTRDRNRDEMRKAYRQQMALMTRNAAISSNLRELSVAENHPTAFQSALIEDCQDRARDIATMQFPSPSTFPGPPIAVLHR